MSAAIQGMRGTGEFDADHRPKNYRQAYLMLEPNGSAPLQAMLSMGASEATDDPEYKQFRDELPERRITVATAVGDTSTGSVVVNAGDDVKFAVKDAILVNTETMEVMRVTADTTGTTVSVDRNVGGTTHNIGLSDELVLAGFAAQENDDVGTAISFDATVHFNYCQIFRTPFGLSNTMDATRLRTGSKAEEVKRKALVTHMMDIERAMFFGRKHEENGGSAQPRRFTGGLLNSITPIDCAGTNGDTAGDKIMTEEEFDEILVNDVFAYGSTQKVAFVGPTVANHMMQFGKDRWQPTQVSGTYGISFQRYHTAAGELVMHLHPMFRQIEAMKDAMVIIDFPKVKFRHLQGRDTGLLTDRQGNGRDGRLHEYLTECGLELLESKVHAYIKNWSFRKA